MRFFELRAVGKQTRRCCSSGLRDAAARLAHTVRGGGVRAERRGAAAAGSRRA
jgi:hypothetical protein